MTKTPMGVGRVFGYARVSTEDQSLEIQVADLVKDGVNPALIFQEKRSGTSMSGRVELERVLAILGPGDILVISRLDRLARSMIDLFSILAELDTLGAHLRVLHQPMDTTTPVGKLYFAAMAMVAETDQAMRRERQAEGIARAKSRGAFKGRPASLPREEIHRLYKLGIPKSKIARDVGCDRKSVERVLKENGVLHVKA